MVFVMVVVTSIHLKMAIVSAIAIVIVLKAHSHCAIATLFFITINGLYRIQCSQCSHCVIVTSPVLCSQSESKTVVNRTV